MTQAMIQAADMSSQTRNRPRRQLIGTGSLSCGFMVRRGMLYSGMGSTISAVTGRSSRRPVDCRNGLLAHCDKLALYNKSGVTIMTGKACGVYDGEVGALEGRRGTARVRGFDPSEATIRCPASLSQADLLG